jgi:hypothetical protein
MSRVTCLDSVAPTLAEPATRTYDELEPTEPEWTRWTGAHALRRRAREHGDRTFLIAPEEASNSPSPRSSRPPGESPAACGLRAPAAGTEW